MWVTTSFVKCDSSPSCEIQEICDKMEMEGECWGVKYGVFQNEPGRVINQTLSQSQKKKIIKLKGMNMCNELCLRLVHVSISLVLFFCQ